MFELIFDFIGFVVAIEAFNFVEPEPNQVAETDSALVSLVLESSSQESMP